MRGSKKSFNSLFIKVIVASILALVGTTARVSKYYMLIKPFDKDVFVNLRKKWNTFIELSVGYIKKLGFFV